MALETNLNVSPYFDDFDVKKDFYKVLFQPGVAVQARELNQLQSILQNQIEKFGDNVFKRGTIIDGCTITKHDKVPYIKINDLTTDGLQIDITLYNNRYVKNSANVEAYIVKTASGLQSRSPDLNTLFVNYISSGNNFSTDSFVAGETLTVFDKSYPIFNIKVNDGASKFANNDSVVVMSALAVQNSVGGMANAAQFVANSVITNGVANAVIIEANITANSTALILKIRPEYSDLISANTIKFRFATGEQIRNVTSEVSANVVAIVGSGAVGSITTDSLGKVTAVQVIGQGSGYYVEPHVTIANNSTTSTATATELGELELVAETFLARVQIANATSVPIGTGYGVTIGEGTIYQKGFFSRVASQFEVVNKYSNTAFDKSVGFYTNESIVNSNQDQTLLDNATGTYNYAAPGADRLKLTPVISVLTKAEADANSEFLPIIEFTDGRPYRINQDTVYNIIGRELAKRTYEESGNYVIDQFLTVTKDSSTFSDTDNLVNMKIDPGKAYINGIRIETIDNYKQNINKGTTKLNDPASQTRLGYGNYYEVDELVGSFNFDIGGQVDLYGSAANYISTGSTTISPVGTKIGTARLRTFTYERGDVGNANAVYRMYLFDIKMNAGQNTKNVRSIYYSGGNKAIADVVLVSGQAELKDTFDSSLLFKLKNATSNVSNITYQYRTISTNQEVASNGVITLSITSNPGEIFPYTEELNTSEKRDLIIIPNGNFKSQTVATGTISTDNNTTSNVVGTGSLFTTQFSPGDYVLLANSTAGNTAVAQIASIANSTLMTLATVPGKTYSGGSITLYYPQNIPISLTNKATKFANCSANSQVMTIYIGNNVANTTNSTAAAMPVSIVYNAQRTNVSSTGKTSKRGNYARIRIANNNSAGIQGPWPLGVSDAYRLRGVWKKNATVQDVTFNVATNIIGSDTANAFITVTNNPFANGDSLLYSNAAGSGVLGGLTNNTAYFAVYANTSGFALSATRGGANLTLTSNSTSVHKFTGNTAYFTENTYGVTDVTNQFFIRSGQNEDYLDISKLVRKPNPVALATNDILLVKFDAFQPAAGVKTISSYTINDSATLASLVSDVNINTMELPEFEGSTGIYYDVRDCVDLRPSAANTINYVTDISSVAAGANAASIINPTFPSNSNYFASTSAFFPVPNSTLSANVSSYLGRVDRVIINSIGGFETRSSEPSISPVVPPSQDNSLTLQIYNIPPYPSLPEILSADMIAIVDTKVESAIAAKRKNSYTIRSTKSATGSAEEKQRVQQQRYRMSDIGSLERRIKVLEYYVSFTLAEALAKARFIPSSLNAALERFKFGFFVDPFTDYAYADVGNAEFYANIRDDQLGPFVRELNLQFQPDGQGQTDGILTLPYNEFVIGEQSIATDGPLETADPGPDPAVDTTGDVTVTTITQRIESVVQLQSGISYSDSGSVFEEFTYLFSNLSGPVELYVASRDNNISATVYQGTSQNGPFTATQTSASAVSITSADISRLSQLGQLASKIENLGELRTKSYPTSIDSGTFLEDQFKLLWTHNPTAGRYVKIRIYKGKNYGAQGRPGYYGYFLQYPTDSVTTNVITTSNPNTFEYTGVVHSINPNSFTITNSLNNYYVFGSTINVKYIADSQKFVISVSGLKTNTNHTFTFDGENRTSKCSQVRTTTTNTTGLRSDENGIMTFDFYYDAGLDEAETDIEAQNRIISNIAGQKRFVIENNDGTSRAAGVITLAYYSNLPVQEESLNISQSTTAASVSQADATTNTPSGGNATESAIDTFIDPSGTYNVIKLDLRNIESQINFNIP